MSNISNENHHASENQDILDDPQVVELLTKYIEGIRKRTLNPEELINDHCYGEDKRKEILREMRFAATLERIYSNQRYQDTEIPTADRTQRTIASTTEIVLNKIRTMKKADK